MVNNYLVIAQAALTRRQERAIADSNQAATCPPAIHGGDFTLSHFITESQAGKICTPCFLVLNLTRQNFIRVYRFNSRQSIHSNTYRLKFSVFTKCTSTVER